MTGPDRGERLVNDPSSAEALPYGVAPAGYRLPAETRVGRVRLQVSQLDRSMDWYGRVLGFGVLERAEDRAVLGVEQDGVPLVELDERRGVAPVGRRARLGLFHFAILLPDRGALGRFVTHLRAAGEPAGASDHLVSEALYLSDPDGLGIEVYADRPRAEWRHRDRQLEMATDPLDLDSLVRAAGGASWEGMPAGTTIGHIHLHVGDLARADAFYHDGLGLDRVVWSYPGALFLSAGGYHHHLGVNTWAGDVAPAGEDDARLLDWEIVVPTADDARHALDSLARAGHHVEDDGDDGDGGVVRDPWGTALRVTVQPR